MKIVFLSWRDLAHPQAGGSEVLVDRLASGSLERGHEVVLLSAGPVGRRSYPVVDIGGTYSQYLRASLAHRRFRDWELLVDVSNGVPFFSPLWRRKPILCLVHHIHRDQWPMRFSKPVASIGWMLESRVVPRLYRHRMFAAVSESTSRELQATGVDPARIRIVPNGVDAGERTVHQESIEPAFIALGRLAPHKRLDLLLRAWERVRPVTGGTLSIVGDGPERARLRPSDGVVLTGRVDDAEKHRLLNQSWLIVHTAAHEGWGIVVMEAAAAGVPALGFDVAGVRDAIVDGQTGALVRTEDELVHRWIDLAGDRSVRERMGAAARLRAETMPWSASVDRFLDVAREAVEVQTVR